MTDMTKHGSLEELRGALTQTLSLGTAGALNEPDVGDDLMTLVRKGNALHGDKEIEGEGIEGRVKKQCR